MIPDTFVDVPPETFDDRHTDHVLDVDGLPIHYTAWGPEDGRTVVMVHGLSVQTHTWDPIADALAATGHRVICPDLRGHGDSGWGQDYWMRSFVADLAALVDHVATGPVALVGHSLGAKIVLAYAGGAGDRVSHVALSDTGPEMPPSASKFTQSVLKVAVDVKGFRTEAEVADHYRAQNPEWREVFIRLHARHQVRESWAGKLVLKTDPELFWLTGSAGARDVPWIWEMTRQIEAPTLVLWGERSPFFDQELADRLLAALRQGELVQVPDCGHYIPREKPEGLMAPLEQFLAS